MRNGCEEFMKCFGFIWLEFLCCEKFFKLGDEICVGENIMSGNGWGLFIKELERLGVNVIVEVFDRSLVLFWCLEE